MDSGLILGQYKVVRLLYLEKEYAAVQAVDILERQKPARLLNIYEGDTARKFAPVFHELQDFDDFLGVRYEKEALIAVFRWIDLPGIDSEFFGGSEQTAKERIQMLEGLFHHALRFYQLPPELGCAAMKNENLRLSTGDWRLRSNYLLAPVEEELSPREFVCLVGDQARKIILPSSDTVYLLRKFLLELEGGRWMDVFALNGAWNDVKEDILEECSKREQAGLLGHLWKKFRDNLKFLREKKRSVYGKQS